MIGIRTATARRSTSGWLIKLEELAARLLPAEKNDSFDIRECLGNALSVSPGGRAPISDPQSLAFQSAGEQRWSEPLGTGGP